MLNDMKLNIMRLCTSLLTIRLITISNIEPITMMTNTDMSNLKILITIMTKTTMDTTMTIIITIIPTTISQFHMRQSFTTENTIELMRLNHSNTRLYTTTTKLSIPTQQEILIITMIIITHQSSMCTDTHILSQLTLTLDQLSIMNLLIPLNTNTLKSTMLTQL